jgi:hypothetical protein
MRSQRKPKSPAAKWYLADLVMQATVDGRKRSVVHINSLLVRSTSNEDAFAKGLKLGRDAEMDNKNEKGKTVRYRFRGFAGLFGIEDELEHGSEIAFGQYVGWSEAKIEKQLKAQDKLSVFAPRDEPVPNAIDFMSAGTVKKLRAAGCDMCPLEKPKRKRR